MPSTQNHAQSVKISGSERVEATRENDSATHRSADLDTPTYRATRAPSREHSMASLLDRYRELLRHQKRHATLVALKDELAEMKLASSGLTAGNLSTTTHEDLTETHSRPHQLETLAVSVRGAVQDLELAVVQAHQEAKREKALLDRAKSSTPDMNQRNPQSRRYAISAVRKELTEWLEQSLDKCQESHDTGERDGEGEVENDGNDDARWEAKIDDQYERYLDARRRLISAVTCLRTPLATQEREATVRITRPLSKSTARLEPTGVVNAIETRLLPSVQQHNTSQAHLTSLDEQLQKETTATINILDRLSDESQLLQAFPLLARSGRFEHAASAFGKKQDTPNEEVQDTISKRLEPWLFAAKAADVASASSAEAYLQQGDEAVQAASRSLDTLRLVKGAGGV
ncbi:hypothetical protein G647_08200 [Cladophialophora carrionii CBS 160.54]|uniref:Uncharacterized protein n=1 Tax=Cladophialophora carrionii CBS 160.54 TaxID=1279043 RepID=V9D0H6_9EURO|nr:uncharacterized protein G647_08200 [Cladophialophora carrionii CBS 160.54]ETI20166.1 hypothetical protein G647_08200 [Cladophialophora carrionii CBS 160.54]